MDGRATLYGVGVGPGDPELLTLKAVRIIEQCEAIAVPRTSRGATVALDIVRGAVDLEGKTIVYLDFVMSRDPHVVAEGHRKAAGLIVEQLRNLFCRQMVFSLLPDHRQTHRFDELCRLDVSRTALHAGKAAQTQVNAA